MTLLLFLLFLTPLEGKNEDFLPQNHPVHRKLDQIFAKERPLLSLKTLRRAGFQKTRPRKFTHLIVTRHPKIPGYIFKLYLDAQRFPHGKAESHFWKMRIQGAKKIRRLIAQKGWDKIFKVPRKWIYKTPSRGLDCDYPVKLTLLVEEDMDLLPSQENRKRWKKISPQKLRALHTILNKNGLKDCAKPDNIPFSRDGKIAFIDTQTHGEESIAYKKLLPFLNAPMQTYWKKLNR